jgi:hypothetical protein
MRFATHAGGTFADLAIEDQGKQRPLRSSSVSDLSLEGVLRNCSGAVEGFI